MEFIPISSTGRTSTTNSILIATALLMISTIRDSGSRSTSFEYRRHAKSQWSPSSRLISSLLKHRPGIKPRFFQPEDGTKGTQKEDAFDGGECNHAFGKAGRGGVTPFESPLCFSLDARYGFDCSKEVLLLRGVLDVCVDEE